MTVLSKEQILQAPDINREVVTVEEWGGEVILQEMSAAARDDFELSLQEPDTSTMGEGGDQAVLNYRNFRSKLLAACLVDENGELLFTPQDVVALGRKSSRVIERLAAKATELNRMSSDDIEEMVGNFDEVPGED